MKRQECLAKKKLGVLEAYQRKSPPRGSKEGGLEGEEKQPKGGECGCYAGWSRTSFVSADLLT